MLTLFAGGAVAVLAVWLLLVAGFARPLRALWREPAFRVPILIFESDDWGPGPPEHARALNAIAGILAKFHDSDGHRPVMTLGVVLAIPRAADANSMPFGEATLQDPHFTPVVDAMQAGVRAGVFQLQLHGRSHYWPDALVQARTSDPAVERWLGEQETWRTEALPAGVQSRWAPELDGATFLIPHDVARTAAEEEVHLFAACLGTPATVAVPTTFIWNPAVEQGWATGGIRAIVTPGRYYRHRGQFADSSSAPMITNGMRSGSLTYVVRDRYFEPYKGHSAEDGLRALEQNTAMGRPTLLETHRINFLDPALRSYSLSAIHSLLASVLSRYPGLRFLSTAELAAALDERRADLVDDSIWWKLGAWCARVRTLPPFWRLARATGLGFVIAGVQRLSAAP